MSLAAAATQAGDEIVDLRCEISLSDDLKSATHVYTYKLLGRSEIPTTSFHFTVPNAGKAELLGISAQEVSFDGRRHEEVPTIDLAPASTGGTKINFGYRTPLIAGAEKVLRFSYTAPSSVYSFSGLVDTVAFYQAHFIHAMPVQALSLEVSLPAKVRVRNVDPLAKPDGRRLEFNASSIPAGQRPLYSVLFTRPRHLRAALVTLGSLALGALLHAFGIASIEAAGHWAAKHLASLTTPTQ